MSEMPPPMPPEVPSNNASAPSGSDLAPRQVGWGEAVKRVFTHYATFKGRASQSEYWKWWLLSSIVAWILWAPAYTKLMQWVSDYSVDSSATLQLGPTYPLAILFNLAIFLPSLAVVVRRLHDVNRSGWFFFVVLIAYHGIVVQMLK